MSSILLCEILGGGVFLIMKAQQQVFDFLKDTMGKSTLLAVAGDMTPFANGSFDNARFLSQLLFWVEVDDREDWTPIPMKEWKDVAQLSRYAIEKARYYFYSIGILEYKVKKDSQGNPTVHYKLNFKALMTELKKFFKDAKRVIFSSFADSFKSKSGQAQQEMMTRTYPLSKEIYKNKNIGQQTKMESKQEKKDKYEKFYL